MKVGIDISQIVYEGTGVASYTRNLIEWLPKIAPESDYVLFGSSLRRRDLLYAFTGNVWPFPPTILDIVWNRWHVFPVENLVGAVDIFHSSDWTQPPTQAKKITTIHDLVIYRFPQFSHPTIVATQIRRLEWVKKECDLILVDSQATKTDCEEILKIAPDRLRVVYLAAAEEFSPQPTDKIASVREKYDLVKNYVLVVGTREPRKNLDRVLEAYSKLNPKNTDLVIAGKFGWGAQGVANEKFKMQNVKLLGYVPQTDLPALYSGAKCFLYPTLYEGFGVPVLESMGCGTPVVTSKLGSLPEVGGPAAFYADPESVEGIADQLAEVLALTGTKRNAAVTKGLAQAKKFSWEKTARETLKAYHELQS